MGVSLDFIRATTEFAVRLLRFARNDTLLVIARSGATKQSLPIKISAVDH